MTIRRRSASQTGLSLLLVSVSALPMQGCVAPNRPPDHGPGDPAANSYLSSTARPFAKATITNLIRTTLASDFVPDREVLIDLVEVPPNTTLERHWHPGEEFHYYLEGEPEIVIEGHPPIHAVQGTIGHIPYQAEHELSTKANGAKIVVFRVHTAGQPLRHLVEHEHAEPVAATAAGCPGPFPARTVAKRD